MRGFVDFNNYIQSTFNNHNSNMALFRHEHDFSGHTIVANVVNNKIYVPVFMSDETVQLVRKEGYLRNLDIVCDIPTIFSIRKISTTVNIFKTFFKSARSSNFVNVITNKEYGYKGTNGIILDDDYKPLIISCNVYDIVDESIEYCGPVFLISPRVFSNTDLISKFIVKSFIPNITNITIHNFKPSVLITNDIDSFVNSPKTPITGLNFNELIYRTLENHINEIVDEPQRILQGLDESDTL